MYETLEHWNQYKLEKQMKPIKKFCEKKNLNKEFDKHKKCDDHIIPLDPGTL